MALAYWVNQIKTGAVTVGAAVAVIANGATSNDQTVLSNKITAAKFFTFKTFAANLGNAPLTQDFLTHAHNAVVNVVDNATLQASQLETGHYTQFGDNPQPSGVQLVGQANDTSHHTTGHG